MPDLKLSQLHWRERNPRASRGDCALAGQFQDGYPSGRSDDKDVLREGALEDLLCAQTAIRDD